MCDKSVDTFPFVFHPVPNQFKSQKMYDIAVLSTLIFVPDWFVIKCYCDVLL